jgi:hypothetical protein
MKEFISNVCGNISFNRHNKDVLPDLLGNFRAQKKAARAIRG